MWGTRQVHNAQKAKYVAVIVANNQCDPATSLVEMGDGDETNGAASVINIPAVFVTAATGALLRGVSRERWFLKRTRRVLRRRRRRPNIPGRGAAAYRGH